jgi:hypothetical protein
MLPFEKRVLVSLLVKHILLYSHGEYLVVGHSVEEQKVVDSSVPDRGAE